MPVIKIFSVILFNFLLASSAREQWIDPHDMATKPSLNKITSQVNNFDSCSEIKKCNCASGAADTFYVHYKRTLSILLNVLQIDQSNSQYKGVLIVNMPTEDYDFLKSFIQTSAEDVTQLRKVNNILDSVFSKTLFQRTSDNFTAWMEWFYFTFYNHNTGIAILSIFVSWTSYKLLRSNWTTWRIVKTLVLFAWLIDFAFTWIHLLQEEEIDKVTDSLKYSAVPPECDPNKMNWWQYTLSFFKRENDCRKYHTTMLQNVFWKVSPFTVFAHQFGIVIATPANNVGKAIGSLVSGMLKPLPFGINYLLLPILLLFFSIIACILLSFITNTSFNINLFHLVSLKIGDKQRHMIGNLLSIPVEIQEEAIENVRSRDRPKRKRVKEKQNCSDEQENVSRIEDISKESITESNKEDNKEKTKDDAVEVKTEIEIKQVVCRIEKNVAIEDT